MVQKKSFIPYLLPLITIIAVIIISFLFFNNKTSNTTGLAVLQNMDEVTSDVRIQLNDFVVVPKDAIVEVYLDNLKASMTVEDFITKSGNTFLIKEGANQLIDYQGEGYTGNYVYEIPLSEFGLSNVKKRDSHLLTIRVIYNDKIISESQKLVEK